MNIFKQLLWIIVFSFLGEITSILVSPVISIPGSVIGMVLLFFALHFGLLKMEQIETVGDWITDNMAIFFVPAGVALITNLDIIANFWWQIIIIVLVSLVATIWLTGLVVQFLKRRLEK